jgi:hypothetical protein
MTSVIAVIIVVSLFAVIPTATVIAGIVAIIPKVRVCIHVFVVIQPRTFPPGHYPRTTCNLLLEVEADMFSPNFPRGTWETAKPASLCILSQEMYELSAVADLKSAPCNYESSLNAPGICLFG